MNRIDAKGRVSIPASFRAVLARGAFPGLFCVRSLALPAIEAGGEALVAAIEATLSRHDPFSAEHTALAALLYGEGDAPTLDGEGRMVMPEWIRAATGISTDVLFVGLGGRFQMWAPDRFEAWRIEAQRVSAPFVGASAGQGERR